MIEATLIPAGGRVERPAWVWIGAVLEVVTAILAIPVGLMFVADPSGGTMQLPPGWIEGSPFGSYLVPGLYLFAVNGVGMLVVAALTARRHWAAPWLTGVLGVGLIVWILVQLAVMPETMILQPIFLGVGVVLGVLALAWLRATGQLGRR